MTEKEQMQKVFDGTARHLLKQGCKSADPRHPLNCRYRADLTPACPIRCAAGFWIPDDRYDRVIENRGVQTPSVLGLIKVDGEALTPGSAMLLRDLQRCHDELETKDWSARLREIAQAYGLNPATADEAYPAE